jgi:hypothetical protein
MGAIYVATPFPIENRSAIPDADFHLRFDSLRRHSSIKHGIDWVFGQTPPGRPIDVVAQDEFSHDVLFELSSDVWLAYSCT